MSKADQMRAMLESQSSKPNITKVLLSEALEKKQESAEARKNIESEAEREVQRTGQNEEKKRGRKARLHPDDKRSVTLTFKTSPKRFKEIEEALIKVNKEKNFGTLQIGISEFVETLVLTHPKFKELLER